MRLEILGHLGLFATDLERLYNGEILGAPLIDKQINNDKRLNSWNTE